MSDCESVLAANRAFYDAFESLDAMEWFRSKTRASFAFIPDGASFRDLVRFTSSWERILDNMFEMKFELGEIKAVRHQAATSQSWSSRRT